MPIINTPRFKSRILLQGLYLVLLPLFINCLLLLALNKLVTQAEAQIENSRQQMTVVLTLTHAIYAVTEIMLAGSNAMMNGSYKFFSPLLNYGWTVVQKDIWDVSKNMTPDDSHNKFERELLDLIDKQKAIFLKGDNRSMGFDSVFIKMRRAGDWVRIGGKQSRLLHAEQAVRREYYSSLFQKQKQEQKVINQIIVVGLIANALLALFLYQQFHRNFMGRISALSKMAKKLPLNEPLNEVISGSDELHEIGVELAKVSWKLSEISEYRRSLMQMMAHDVRSPLMAADISIATLSKFANKSLTESGIHNLEEAAESLQNSLTLVNDLLLLESFENGEVKPHLKDCDVAELVSRVIEDAPPQNCAPIYNACKSLLIKVDREQISRVVERMLLSAISRAPRNSTITVSNSLSDNILRLEVTDQAERLTEIDAKKIFDKLHQARIAGGGKTNSLGLSIAVPIMESHQGSIQVDLTKDGNCIFIEIPVNQTTSCAQDRETQA